jgi:hypothetical protein
MNHARNFTLTELCKGEDYIIISDKLAVLTGWAGYFTELLNGSSNEHLITKRAINIEIEVLLMMTCYLQYLMVYHHQPLIE